MLFLLTIIPLTVIVAGDRSSLQPFGRFLGSFLLTNEHLFNTRERSAWTCYFCLCWFQSPGPEEGEPWCIDLALSFDYPVVNGCLFVVCLVLFAWGLCIAALLCLVCLWAQLPVGNLAPLPADKSDWRIHQFVRVHIPWHIHQT